MNFNAVILILAGIAEIARIAEKLAQRFQRLYIWKPNFSDLSDPSDGAAITIAGINRTRFYLLSAIPAIES